MKEIEINTKIEITADHFLKTNNPEEKGNLIFTDKEGNHYCDLEHYLDLKERYDETYSMKIELQRILIDELKRENNRYSYIHIVCTISFWTLIFLSWHLYLDVFIMLIMLTLGVIGFIRGYNSKTINLAQWSDKINKFFNNH